MSVSCACEERVMTAWLSGEVDHHAAKQIMEKMDGLIELELPRCLRVDLSAVTFMDSSGIAVLLRIYRRVKEIDGRVTVRGTPEQAMKVLKAAGLQKLMKFE